MAKRGEFAPDGGDGNGSGEEGGRKAKDPLADLTKQVSRLADALKSQGDMLKCGLSIRDPRTKEEFRVYGTVDDMQRLQRRLAEPWRADL